MRHCLKGAWQVGYLEGEGARGGGGQQVAGAGRAHVVQSWTVQCSTQLGGLWGRSLQNGVKRGNVEACWTMLC